MSKCLLILKYEGKIESSDMIRNINSLYSPAVCTYLMQYQLCPKVAMWKFMTILFIFAGLILSYNP